METMYWKVDKNVDNINSCPQIQQAAHLLKQNEVVAFPTETVYGLGGNAKDDEAIKKIFAAKGRPSDNPLIIHIAKQKQLTKFVEEVPAVAKQLIEKFWPGALTIIFRMKKGALSSYATAGLSTVAVRMPDHPIALRLLEEANLPIAAPSANQSGKPSPTSGSHVKEDLDGKIAGIVDGGSTGIGVESTVIDCTEQIPVILRPGGITLEQIESVIGEVRLDSSLTDKEAKPKAPGMKYSHYAPDVPLFLVKGTKERIQLLINEAKQNGKRVGVLTTNEHQYYYDADYVFACGAREDLETVASSLYEGLRSFNHKNVDIIYSEMFPEAGVGQAIMNRLIKAAAHQVIE